MSKPRKRWPFVLFALAGLLFVLVFLFMRDDKRGDYPELAPTPHEARPNGQAAFDAWLVAFGKADGDVLRDAYTDDRKFYLRLDGSEPWDPEGIAKVLSPNQEALAAAWVADGLGAFTLPPVRDLSTSIPHLGEFQMMAKLFRIAALERHFAGDPTAACDASLLGLRLGDRLVQSSHTLIDYLVGITAHAIASAGIERLAAEGTPDTELMRIDAALKQEIDVHEGLAESLRRDFVVTANTIDNLEQLWPAMYGSARKRLPMFLLKKNRTYNMCADRQLIWVRNATLPPDQREEVKPHRPNWLSSNAAGEQMFAETHGVAEIADRADLVLAQRRLLRLKIALFRHHRDQGALPADLSALVPKYIEAIPTDPSDGKLIRYDPARAAVWVVGSDFKDDGGATAPGKRGFSNKAPDPTMFVFPLTAPAP
jgi:hypothetical protein